MVCRLLFWQVTPVSGRVVYEKCILYDTSWWFLVSSKQAISAQIGLDDDIVYSRHNKLDLLGVGCTCEMRIYLFPGCGTRGVELSKSLHDVLTCIVVAVTCGDTIVDQ